MFKIEVIGNLGADAQVKGENGKQFVSFNVAHSDRWTDEEGTTHEQTQWVSCIINDTQSKVLPYLLKGKTVFVRGDARLRVFSSEKERRMVAGVTVNVREIELIGGKVDPVPSQLINNDGVVFPVYKAFYIDPSTNPMPNELHDRNLTKFAINEHGFVTTIAPTQEPTEQVEAENPHQGTNAKPF